MATGRHGLSKNDARAGLSRQQAQILSTLSGRGQEIFTLSDLKQFNLTKAAAKMFVARLVKKKWIIRIARGKYLISPLSAGRKGEWTVHEFVLATSMISPAYVSYWNALNYYGWTEQIPRVITVVSLKRRKPANAQMVRVRFVTVSKKKFFGHVKMDFGGTKAFVASKEKAVVDCLDRPDLCGGVAEIAKALDAAKNELNLGRLVEYAGRVGNSAVLRRLGYLCEKLGIALGVEPRFKGYVWLDPSRKKIAVAHNSRWGLKINVAEKGLFEWRVAA
jgi:predicted transcriptional regulator of viral defense system